MQYSSNPPEKFYRTNAGAGRGKVVLQNSISPSAQISMLVVFLLLFHISPATLHASDFKGPWQNNDAQKLVHKNMDQKTNPLQFLVRAYQANISPIDGRNCPMYPSCSTYSLQCFQKHGLFIGWIMTCDRLFRCGRDELRLSPHVYVNGKYQCYDPLKENDFWWYHAP